MKRICKSTHVKATNLKKCFFPLGCVCIESPMGHLPHSVLGLIGPANLSIFFMAMPPKSFCNWNSPKRQHANKTKKRELVADWSLFTALAFILLC